MSERLIIDNFAGIQHLELDLNRINILIGPQAVGKSICAKLLHYFKSFVQDLSTSPDGSKKAIEDVEAGLIGRFEKYFPPRSWPKGAFEARYELGDAFIRVARIDGEQSQLELDYSQYFREEFKSFQVELSQLGEAGTKKGQMDLWQALFAVQTSQVQRINARLGYPAGFGRLFIPAGRSFFAYLQKGLFSLMQSGYAVDPLLVEFGSFYEAVQAFGLEHLKRLREGQQEDIERAIHSILCGEYVREQDEDLIRLDDGRITSIASSSSGQQEVLPLAVVLQSLSSGLFGGLGYSVSIEEPEAHLFPTAQQRVVELLAMVFNASEIPLQFIITTHSPYILTAFNNLMQAGSLAKTLPKKRLKELDAIVPSAQRLDRNVVAAYVLEEGTGRSIICEDTGLISAELIDRVSDDLAIEFDKLLDLE